MNLGLFALGSGGGGKLVRLMAAGSSPYTRVEPRYSELLYNEVLDITNGFLHPSNSKIYEIGPQYNETSL